MGWKPELLPPLPLPCPHELPPGSEYPAEPPRPGAAFSLLLGGFWWLLVEFANNITPAAPLALQTGNCAQLPPSSSHAPVATAGEKKPSVHVNRLQIVAFALDQPPLTCSAPDLCRGSSTGNLCPAGHLEVGANPNSGLVFSLQQHSACSLPSSCARSLPPVRPTAQ